MWPKYGFEFHESSKFFPYLIYKLKLFLAQNQLTVPEAKIAVLSKALDFTELTGSDAHGNEVDVGRKFFTGVALSYKASKNIDPGSPGTTQFVNYLKKRGRQDLLEKYFSEQDSPEDVSP